MDIQKYLTKIASMWARADIGSPERCLFIEEYNSYLGREEYLEITCSGWAGEVWDDLEPNLQTIDNLLAV